MGVRPAGVSRGGSPCRRAGEGTWAPRGRGRGGPCVFNGVRALGVQDEERSEGENSAPKMVQDRLHVMCMFYHNFLKLRGKKALAELCAV